MKIVLAGGTGFLGQPLARVLTARGYDVVILTRASPHVQHGRAVVWNPDGNAVRPGEPWAREIDGADAIVNLVGENIGASRWTSRRKAILRESRILSTRRLVAAVRAATCRPATFVSTSGVNYYGTTDDMALDESSPPGSDFLARLCVDWEAEARAAEGLGCRVAILRSGIVLAGRGGVLDQLRRPFLLFVGGPIGSGRQYVSWIHQRDWIELVMFVLQRPGIAGALNATAPQPVTNAEFSQALAETLRRPNWLRTPGVLLRLLFGEMAETLVINGQRVLPRRVLEAGFAFGHPNIREALASLKSETSSSG